MSKNNNATCAICGKKYHVCNTCKKTKTLRSWRTITDTTECYKIYMILHDYTNGAIPKEKAKKLLKNCTLPLSMQPHIQAAVDEIMG